MWCLLAVVVLRAGIRPLRLEPSFASSALTGTLKERLDPSPEGRSVQFPEEGAPGRPPVEEGWEAPTEPAAAPSWRVRWGETRPVGRQAWGSRALDFTMSDGQRRHRSAERSQQSSLVTELS